MVEKTLCEQRHAGAVEKTLCVKAAETCSSTWSSLKVLFKNNGRARFYFAA